jgi:hypothetical protein
MLKFFRVSRKRRTKPAASRKTLRLLLLAG